MRAGGTQFWLAPSLAIALAALGCASGPPDEDEVAAELTRADEAMTAMSTRLVEALTGALSDGGPVGAIEVCREAAPSIAAGVSSELELRVGRTSHRLRNPDNAPPAWAAEIVQRSAGTQAEAAERHVLDLGDRIGVLAPIGTLGLCTTCHGDPQTLEPELRAALDRAYPEDQATGFAVGDLRGWMWAEVSRGR